MQTTAEQFLITALIEFLDKQTTTPQIINLGAAKSLVIEKFLKQADLEFSCDRSDVQDCSVSGENIGKCYVCPLEKMTPVPTAKYAAAFANFVLEHVSDPAAAAQEMARILKPGDRLIITLSNPLAPEFQLASLTPTAFHQLFRGVGIDEAYPVKYAYGTIEKMIKLLEESGLKLLIDQRFAFTYGYLYRFRGLNLISKLYDSILEKFHWRSIMSHACLILEKK